MPRLSRLALSRSLASLSLPLALSACAPSVPDAQASAEAPPASVVVVARAAPLASAPPSAQARGPAASAGAAAPAAPSALAAPAAPSPGADAAAKASASAGQARLGAVGRGAHVWAGRNRKVQLGTLRPGTSVALRSAKTVGGGEGCKSNRWWEVEPLGYVCDDAAVTRDLEGDLFRALARLAPGSGAEEGVLPFGYAYSTGAPMYGKLPSPAEQQKAERKYRPVDKLKRPEHPSGHEELAQADGPGEPSPLPFFVKPGAPLPSMPYQREGLVRKDVREGNLISFQGAVAGEGGRLFLLATNLTLVPADRVRVFRPSAFHGVELGGEAKAPLAWSRRKPAPQFRKEASGAMAESGASVPPRTAVMLTGNTAEHGGVTYHETREGAWLRGADVSVVTDAGELPKGVDPGEKWVDVSLSQGTLTLYDGTRALFSTLSSPGAGGTTQSAGLSVDELLAGAFSPLGVYRVAFKYRSAVMTPEEGPEPEKTWIDDVPYVLYFRPPFAIHGVYWHEDFGMPKSGGCINLSPLDARRVFDWAEPRVPEGWYGASNALPDQPGTKVSIRK